MTEEIQLNDWMKECDISTEEEDGSTVVSFEGYDLHPDGDWVDKRDYSLRWVMACFDSRSEAIEVLSRSSCPIPKT